VARHGVEYLLTHAWDDRYGGWYDRLTVDGEPWTDFHAEERSVWLVSDARKE